MSIWAYAWVPRYPPTSESDYDYWSTQLKKAGVPYDVEGGHGLEGYFWYQYVLSSSGKLKFYRRPDYDYYELASQEELAERKPSLPQVVTYITGDLPNWVSAGDEAFLQKVGLATPQGEILTEQIFDPESLPMIDDGMVMMLQNQAPVYYSIESKKLVTDNIYSPVWPNSNFEGFFAEGICPVQQNGKYGFINKSGEVVVPIEFDGASHVYSGTAWVKQNGLWGKIRFT